ncbi:hypothetical protein ACTL6P_15400 [Endozoicomonas acroporae]|uniref:hypothetical protein n=1 Tax=Endozoicomonas acroporae TaxID=1701104 RepID=UPI000C77764B|nr:hypothetical protein [Endozoicomonas acroporae]
MSITDRLKNKQQEYSCFTHIKNSIEDLMEAKEAGYSYSQIHNEFCEKYKISLNINSFKEYFRRAKREFANE